MNRADVTELHYITAIANVPSILRHGILSHTLANQLAHDSVDMPEIQERRRNKQIPGARPLHEYANLYFDAHNPMLSRCRARNNEICVLQIDRGVLDVSGVIVANRNAASNWTSFWPVTDGLGVISRERVFARGLAVGRLAGGWEAIVGPRLAAESAPVSLDAGVLVIAASSGPWGAQARFLGEEIRKKVNATLGSEEVRKVQVVVRPEPRKAL